MTDDIQPAGTDPATGTAVEEPKKLRQTVELKDIGPCKKHIKVTVERENIDEALNEQYSKLVKDSNVSGFRPGKAPRKIIERRFRKEVVDQVKTELLFKSLEQLAEEQDVAPLSPPDLDPNKIELPEKGAFIYEFDVEVRPEFDLPNYKGLKLRRPVREFTDADVAAEEYRLLAQYGSIVPKPEGVAKAGDIVIADMTSRDGDRVLGEHKELQITMEKQLVLKDGVIERFAEQLEGAKAGDTRVLDVKMSHAAADPALRGKTVQTAFEIKDVKQMRLPELTHEFLHTFGVHSAEQLREKIRVVLNRRLEYQQRSTAREQVLSHIAAAATWDLPEELLIRQSRSALSRRVMEMRSEGIAEDEIRGRIRMLEQDAVRSTAASLKEHFVLQKIAETEKIDIDDEDIDDEIERIGAMNDESPRRIRARLEKEDMLDALAAEMVERKALDLILESAEYEDVPMDADKLQDDVVTTVEQQVAPGEMQDPMALPPPEAMNPEGST